MVIQSSNQMMTVMWVSEQLPNIFIEVIKNEQNKIESDKQRKDIDEIVIDPSILNQNPTQILHCDRCTFTSKSVYDFKKHVESKHFDCGKCSYSTSIANDLKTHFQKGYSAYM